MAILWNVLEIHFQSACVWMGTFVILCRFYRATRFLFNIWEYLNQYRSFYIIFITTLPAIGYDGETPFAYSHAEAISPATNQNNFYSNLTLPASKNLMGKGKAISSMSVQVLPITMQLPYIKQFKRKVPPGQIYQPSSN